MTETLVIALIISVLLVAYELHMLRRLMSKNVGRGIVLLFFTSEANSQQSKPFVGPVQPPKLERLVIPADVQALTLLDAAMLPADARVRTRYVWLREHTAEDVKSVAATLNRISRSPNIYHPAILAQGRLVRIDLAYLCFDVEKDLQEIVDTWELLRFEPAFNELLTPDAQKVVSRVAVSDQPIAITRDGKAFKKMAYGELAEQAIVRVLPRHLDPDTALALQVELLTAAPIVTKEYFETRVLNSIRDQKDGKNTPFTDLSGGLYYDFKGLRQIVKNKKKGQTDLDALLEHLGATGKRLAEQRVGMFRSNVTGKPRAIEFLPATNRRLGDGPAAVVITNDVKDSSIDATQHAMLSLRKATLKPDAFEVIWIDANGFNAYALFDGQGNLQDEAPPDVVADTTVPNPHTKRLSTVSCIRCHEAEGSDGWKSTPNDVQTLVDRGLKLFGDVSDPNRAIIQTLTEIESQYKGKPDKFLQTARFAYQSAMVDATGPWTGKPTDILKVSAKKFESDYNAYVYSTVSPDRALRELGFRAIPKSEAPAFLAKLLRPDPESRAFGIQPKDVRIFSLTHGIEISRTDWSLVFSFAMTQAQKELRREMQEKKP